MQCIYLFTQQEAEIVGNSRQGGSVVNSLGGVFIAPHVNVKVPFVSGFSLSLRVITLKNLCLPLCSSRSHKYKNYDKGKYIASPNLCLFTCPQATGFPLNSYPQINISAKRGFVKFIPLPPGIKTSWRRRRDVSLYVPVMSQVRLKLNTQRRLDGTSPRRLSGASLRRVIGTL